MCSFSHTCLSLPIVGENAGRPYRSVWQREMAGQGVPTTRGSGREKQGEHREGRGCLPLGRLEDSFRITEKLTSQQKLRTFLDI